MKDGSILDKDQTNYRELMTVCKWEQIQFGLFIHTLALNQNTNHKQFSFPHFPDKLTKF